AHVIDRARKRGEMEDVVDRLVDLDRLGHVVVEERERLVAQVRDVLERPRLQVVDTDNAVTLVKEVVAQVRTEEAGAAGDDRGRHAAGSYSGHLMKPRNSYGPLASPSRR